MENDSKRLTNLRNLYLIISIFLFKFHPLLDVDAICIFLIADIRVINKIKR